jgi:hypothetical protein
MIAEPGSGSDLIPALNIVLAAFQRNLHSWVEHGIRSLPLTVLQSAAFSGPPINGESDPLLGNGAFLFKTPQVDRMLTLQISSFIYPGES